MSALTERSATACELEKPYQIRTTCRYYNVTELAELHGLSGFGVWGEAPKDGEAPPLTVYCSAKRDQK